MVKRRELLTSKKAPWNRHFLHHKCQTPVGFDSFRSGLFRLMHATQRQRRDRWVFAKLSEARCHSCGSLICLVSNGRDCSGLLPECTRHPYDT
jgi:hypothetical protein